MNDVDSIFWNETWYDENRRRLMAINILQNYCYNYHQEEKMNTPSNWYWII